MNNLKTEPMVKHSNQVRKEVSNAFAKVQDYEHAIKSLKGEPVLVHTTTDYFIFKPTAPSGLALKNSTSSISSFSIM